MGCVVIVAIAFRSAAAPAWSIVIGVISTHEFALCFASFSALRFGGGAGWRRWTDGRVICFRHDAAHRAVGLSLRALLFGSVGKRLVAVVR